MLIDVVIDYAISCVKLVNQPDFVEQMEIIIIISKDMRNNINAFMPKNQEKYLININKI